ncbi:MAG: DUF1972 domain-containing protein, partial [Lachnospiraceae bacterium]|nr:DUF1972 domain-containing protein [Lachnospiraceae bacterium]
LQYCCNYIKDNNIEHPIVYVLSSRVGFCMGYFARKIHKAGGKYWNNPDGRESLRRKYNSLVRKYWALSERGMVKHSDLVICDNRHIEQYIQDEYRKYEPMTTYIAYGSDIEPSEIADDAPQYKEWLANWKLKDHEYYISVGRFVPENNFEVMIREFMKSNTKKDFAIITTENDKFLEKLDVKLHFKKDSRIKFVGTVYDRQLLKKIRENAYGYIHGHEVGGTNPSLLEALGSTDLNLVYDVGFNRECGADGALYWGTNDGDLAHLIDDVDKMKQNEINALGCRARRQIQEYYSWQFIANEYENLFLNRN